VEAVLPADNTDLATCTHLDASPCSDTIDPRDCQGAVAVEAHTADIEHHLVGKVAADHRSQKTRVPTTDPLMEPAWVAGGLRKIGRG
jgi:hypothetical protein